MRSKIFVYTFLILLIVFLGGCIGSDNSEPLNEGDQDNEFWYYFEQGNMYLQNGQYQDAINKYNEAISIDSTEHPEVWAYRGSAYYALGMYSEAALNYEKGLELGYEDLETRKYHAYSVYGTALFGTGSYEDAINLFENVLIEDPDDPSIWSYLGYSLHEIGNYEDAIRSLEKAIDLNSNKHDDFNSNTYENYYYIGSSYYHLNDEESALNYFNKAIEINPQAEDAVDFRDYLLNK
ncbi:tetratricopeptide repeat protein [Methanosalsum zhilinae]|nr:tetratricopeptide repeat protein [Methanosalsum zhilinae]